MVACASFVVMGAILVYALISLVMEGIGVIGSSLVDVELPNPYISPVYAKPITLLYAAALIFMYTELELIRERVVKLQDGTVHVFRLLAFFAAVVAFFELAYNLIFWGGEIAAESVLGHLNPDTIANYYPDLTHPINLVFATKIAAAVLIAGVYVFYYLTRVQDAKLASSSRVPLQP